MEPLATESDADAKRRLQRLSAKARTNRVVRRDVDRYITRLVDAAPPLSAEQRARLATLLTPGGSDGP